MRAIQTLVGLLNGLAPVPSQP